MRKIMSTSVVVVFCSVSLAHGASWLMSGMQRFNDLSTSLAAGVGTVAGQAGAIAGSGMATVQQAQQSAMMAAQQAQQNAVAGLQQGMQQATPVAVQPTTQGGMLENSQAATAAQAAQAAQMQEAQEQAQADAAATANMTNVVAQAESETLTSDTAEAASVAQASSQALAASFGV